MASDSIMATQIMPAYSDTHMPFRPINIMVEGRPVTGMVPVASAPNGTERMSIYQITQVHPQGMMPLSVTERQAGLMQLIDQYQYHTPTPIGVPMILDHHQQPHQQLLQQQQQHQHQRTTSNASSVTVHDDLQPHPTTQVISLQQQQHGDDLATHPLGLQQRFDLYQHAQQGGHKVQSVLQQPRWLSMEYISTEQPLNRHQLEASSPAQGGELMKSFQPDEALKQYEVESVKFVPAAIGQVIQVETEAKQEGVSGQEDSRRKPRGRREAPSRKERVRKAKPEKKDKGEQEPVSCPECGHSFLRMHNLKLHLLRHKGEKPFVCDVCHASFVEARNLRRHMITHKSERPHLCNECGASFLEACNLKRHMRTHSGKRLFICDVCGAAFSRPTYLKDHVLTHRGSDVFKCDECEATFSNAHHLRKHMKEHTGGRPYKCNDCSKVFGWWSAYKRHKLKHEAEAKGEVTVNEGKRSKCDQCGATFNRPCKLQRHLLLHTGQRPFSCTVCSATFTQVYHLRAHMQRHAGDKPHRCVECGSSFLEQDKLKRHMRVHDEQSEKAVVCEECGARFSIPRHLTNHRKLHREEEAGKKAAAAAAAAAANATTNITTTTKYIKVMSRKRRLKVTLAGGNVKADLEVKVEDEPTQVAGGRKKAEVSSEAVGERLSKVRIKVPESKVRVAKTDMKFATIRVGAEKTGRAREMSTPSMKRKQEGEETKQFSRDRKKFNSRQGKSVKMASDTTEDEEDLDTDETANVLVEDRSEADYGSDTEVEESYETVPHADLANDKNSWRRKPSSASKPKETEETRLGFQETGDRLSPSSPSGEHATKVDEENDHKEYATSFLPPETGEAEDEADSNDDIMSLPVNFQIQTSEFSPFGTGFIPSTSANVSGCDKPSMDFTSLQETTNTAADEEQCRVLFSCKICSAIFNSFFALKMHKAKHVAFRSCICIRCGDDFASAEVLRDHLTSCTGYQPPAESQGSEHETEKAALVLPASLDGRKIQRRMDHKYKKNGAGDPKRHECPQCGAAFSQFSKLKIHQLIHDPDRHHHCNDCGAAFRKARDLRDHARTHNDERPFICDVCSASYTQHSTLLIHKRTHTGYKPHVCKDCGATFPRANRLRVHMRIHTGERPYICQECGMDFKWNADLKKHMTLHNDADKYKCPHCSLAFSSQKKFNLHLQIHSGERPFVCKECQRPFKKATQLKRHERIHTGVKSYLCDECGSGFLTASSLKLHRTTHTGEKRFICEECGKGFRVHNRLVRHMACHTTDELFLIKNNHSSVTLPSSDSYVGCSLAATESMNINAKGTDLISPSVHDVNAEFAEMTMAGTNPGLGGLSCSPGNFDETRSGIGGSYAVPAASIGSKAFDLNAASSDVSKHGPPGKGERGGLVTDSGGTISPTRGISSSEAAAEEPASSGAALSESGAKNVPQAVDDGRSFNQSQNFIPLTDLELYQLSKESAEHILAIEKQKHSEALAQQLAALHESLVAPPQQQKHAPSSSYQTHEEQELLHQKQQDQLSLQHHAQGASHKYFLMQQQQHQQQLLQRNLPGPKTDRSHKRGLSQQPKPSGRSQREGESRQHQLSQIHHPGFVDQRPQTTTTDLEQHRHYLSQQQEVRLK